MFSSADYFSVVRPLEASIIFLFDRRLTRCPFHLSPFFQQLNASEKERKDRNMYARDLTADGMVEVVEVTVVRFTRIRPVCVSLLKKCYRHRSILVAM